MTVLVDLDMVDEFLAHLDQVRARCGVREAETTGAGTLPALAGTLETCPELEQWGDRTAALGAQVERDLAGAQAALETFLAETEAWLSRLRSAPPAAPPRA
ncbi:MAG TPA: hypothetical protein PKD86_11740 [Gemmatales bacterium]|nr:hypothetical protein [Gemmatales bacterium]HMP60015.1 hypothetical protein [Gemmatales bacterium]